MAGEIIAYVANIAHHADVGGMVPGSEAAVCQSIFQEGLRMPLVRIMRADGVNRDVLDLIYSTPAPQASGAAICRRNSPPTMWAFAA